MKGANKNKNKKNFRFDRAEKISLPINNPYRIAIKLKIEKSNGIQNIIYKKLNPNFSLFSSTPLIININKKILLKNDG